MERIMLSGLVSLALLACSRSPPPPLQLNESDLVGTYVAQRATLGHPVRGSIELRADGTFVRQDEGGRHRRTTGTWKLGELRQRRSLQLSLPGDPPTGGGIEEKELEDYGGRLAILEDSDVGFRYVKIGAGLDAGRR